MDVVCAHSPEADREPRIRVWKAYLFPRWIMCIAKQKATHIINDYSISFYTNRPETGLGSDGLICGSIIMGLVILAIAFPREEPVAILFYKDSSASPRSDVVGICMISADYMSWFIDS